MWTWKLLAAGGTFRLLLLAAAFALLSRDIAAQGVTGSLIGTVSDDQGGVLRGAIVRASSPALIGSPVTTTTNEKGQLHVPNLPPGSYGLEIELQGFAIFREDGIRVGAGATIERTVTLRVAGVAESVVVEGAGSGTDAQNPGFGTRFGPEALRAIPTRRASMFDFIRVTPGISPTSPSSGTATSGTTTTVSAFGSGTNENQFLVDGTNFTCPCNGVARAEAGVDFIQEVQVQSVGASAEFGNVQGAVINMILRQGGDRLQLDAGAYGQPGGLTSEPVRLRIPGSTTDSGYARTRYRDFTTSLGGSVVRDRLWFFGGYQYLRDYDSQPGTPPEQPRTAESDKIYGKLTWKLAPGWQLVQSFHDEFQDNHDQPTIVLPFEATLHRTATVPATTFANLTHVSSSSTVWNVLVGRFVFSQDNAPATGDRLTPSRFDSVTNITSGAPPLFSTLRIARTTVKATLTRYRAGLFGADHTLKVGGQFEDAGHDSVNVIPTGVRFVDRNGQPSQSISANPAHVGGSFVTSSAFATDALQVGSRLTINAGVRFDHSRAISQDLPAVDLDGHDLDQVVQGLGTLYSWNLWSPRLGLAAKLSADGRTKLRASYGRFSQGVLTGELEPFHPGGTTMTTLGFDPATGSYSTVVSIVNPHELLLDAAVRAPHTDEYSIGIDREVGRTLALAVAVVRKNGSDFIGWTDVGGQYAETTAPLKDGRTMTVYKLTNKPSDRRYLLTNPDDYSLTYNGLVAVVEKRLSDGWQALASYTFSRAYGLQPSSGTTAAGAQVSTIAPPQPSIFGRDPNDLINARGVLPNDRPNIFRVMGSVNLAQTGIVVAANLQQYSGKPWAATSLINPQNAQQRVLIETRGTRRISSQTLLDLRVSKAIGLGSAGRIELLFDVLNALNDTAEESIASDDFFNATFGQPTTFVDPRRVMLGIRMNVGR